MRGRLRLEGIALKEDGDIIEGGGPMGGALALDGITEGGGPPNGVGDALGGPAIGAIKGELGNVLLDGGPLMALGGASALGGPMGVELGGPSDWTAGGPTGGPRGVELGGPGVGGITKGEGGKLLLAATVGTCVEASVTDPGGTNVEATGVGVGIGAPMGVGGGLKIAVGASSTKFGNGFGFLFAGSFSIWSSGLTPKIP